MMVIDPGIATLAVVARVIDAGRRGSVLACTFEAFQPNPTTADVAAGVEAYRTTECDGVVAIGGGSAMDVGKAVALMVGQNRPLRDFDDREDNWKRADASAIPPVIAIPTTSGTGSEVGRAAVVTDPEIHRKIIAFHPRLMPQLAILDPELTVNLPPPLTAATGLDALSHCLEAYFAPSFHPFADAIALEGFRLVCEWLPRAYRDGSDLVARGNMMIAAAMGATAFQKGLGAVHSLSHAVGARYGSHHGLTNGVFLPYVMQFNRSAIESKAVTLARHAGIEPASFDGLMERVSDLRRSMSIPERASGLGVEEADIEELAASAAIDPTATTNPLPVGQEEFRELLTRSLRGTLE